MVILIHVIIAIISISIATIGFFRPSLKTFGVSYGFILATLISGTLLLISSPSHVLQSCISGITYLTAVSAVTVASHLRMRKFATEKARNVYSFSDSADLDV